MALYWRKENTIAHRDVPTHCYLHPHQSIIIITAASIITFIISIIVVDVSINVWSFLCTAIPFIGRAYDWKKPKGYLPLTISPGQDLKADWSFQHAGAGMDNNNHNNNDKKKPHLIMVIWRVLLKKKKGGEGLGHGVKWNTCSCSVCIFDLLKFWWRHVVVCIWSAMAREVPLR